MQQPPSPTPPEQPPYSTPSEQSPQFAAYPPPPGQVQPQPAYSPYPAQPNYGYSFPPSQPQSTSKIALKYGLIFGAIMVAVALLRYAFNLVVSPALLMRQFDLSYSQISLYTLSLTAIFTLIYWGIYFCAGLFAARQARQIGTASFACLWASLCYFAIYCMLTGINFLLHMTPLMRSILFRTSYLTSLASGFAIVLIVQIGLGCGIGALGGLRGKNLVRREAPSAQYMR